MWEQKIKRHGNLAGGIICIVNLEIVYFYLEIVYFYVIGMLYLEVKVKINSDRLKELYVNNLKQLRRIFLRECQSKIRRIAGYVTDF